MLRLVLLALSGVCLLESVPLYPRLQVASNAETLTHQLVRLVESHSISMSQSTDNYSAYISSILNKIKSAISGIKIDDDVKILENMPEGKSINFYYYLDIQVIESSEEDLKKSKREHDDQVLKRMLSGNIKGNRELQDD